MSKRQNLYLGRSGQMAVMAEFLARGYNVAIPEVDRGDDLFVVRDADGDLSRIQVKSASAQPLQQGFSARFSLALSQVLTPTLPDLHFVFAVRQGARWSEYLLLPRRVLFQEHTRHGIGSIAGNNLVLYLSFTTADVRCSGRSWQSFRDDWSVWPILQH